MTSAQRESRQNVHGDDSFTRWLAKRINSLHDVALSEDVITKAKDRLVDSIAACVSGSNLPPGRVASNYVLSMGGAGESVVVGTDVLVPAVNAALANAMMAHADETDDVDLVTKAHPGCCVIPAALAAAERARASGDTLIRGVVAGYDCYCRMLQALGSDELNELGRSRQGFGSTFGAAAAAGLVLSLEIQEIEGLLSVASQQASGTVSWARDVDHIEKAFDLAGMGARNGIAAATMVRAGMTGVPGIFEGEPSVLRALQPTADPGRAMVDPASWTVRSAIKEFPVGYPIQAVLSSLREITQSVSIPPDQVESIIVEVPPDGAAIVDGRAMPSINLQHVVALWILDGDVTFESVHSEERMRDEAIQSITRRIELVPSPDRWDAEATRQAAVTVVLEGGNEYFAETRFARGSPQNPMTSAEVDSKARQLMSPVLGEGRCDELIGLLRSLENMHDVTSLQLALTGWNRSTQ